MKTIYTVLFIITFHSFGFAQCNLSNITNTISNNKADCSDSKMVISIDNTITISENCGNIRFTPVLTGVKKPTSVNDLRNGVGISIFPIPFTDQIQIDFSTVKDKYSAEIFDLLGRLVYSGLELFPEQINHFSLNHLDAGTYLILLKSKNSNKMINYKLIKI